MFSKCVLVSTKALFRHSLRPYTKFGILKFTDLFLTQNLLRGVISQGKINNSRELHNNKVCLGPVQTILKKGTEERDTLELGNGELFPTILLQDSSETKQTLTIPAGASQEFYNLYIEIINKTQPTTPLHEFPKHGRLNNLIYHIKTREDALLLPKAVSQWRKKLLPSTPITTRFIIKKCCEVNAEDVVFHMLTDRTKYALLPNREGFRWIMLAFANKIVDPSSEKKISLDKQEILDYLYKTFGLMAYYDVSQYDAHLYAILISASLKLDSKKGWERVDVTASEFLENLDKMDNEALELHPISPDEEEELKRRNDKFSEYSVESRISRLVSCIDMVDILDKWYTESKQDTAKAENFRILKESWKNEIKKLKIEEGSLL
ncbi:hypothetical protein C1645_749949 [Glomus cerebriforme]|uniref:Uncharacterized protein n=1 Tax=Glomus cerebriforme TaxID=658196 RepID=A0A397TM68_9GLOM|nr:hypothetical protein C1645_749949 [Glomus cerebriforme]